MRTFLFPALALAIAVPAALPAQASEICAEHPKAEWMSAEAITDLVKGQGYTVAGVKAEDGCWEVKGKKDGKRVEAYFDPVSGNLVLVK